MKFLITRIVPNHSIVKATKHIHWESSSRFASSPLASLEFGSRNSMRCSFVPHPLPWRFFESSGYGVRLPSSPLHHEKNDRHKAAHFVGGFDTWILSEIENAGKGIDGFRTKNVRYTLLNLVMLVAI